VSREPTDGQNAGNLREPSAENVMSQPRIISDRAEGLSKGLSKSPASSQIGDWHDVIGHHRYYGSSAISGEPIAESRRGARPRTVNVFGF
jgi:hypothetical protein